MGGKNSKIEFKKTHIVCAVVNNFIYHINNLTIENLHQTNNFNITHIYGINGEKWIDNHFTNTDFVYDDKNLQVKYTLQNIKVQIFLKERSYNKLKLYLHKFPNHYINDIL